MSDLTYLSAVAMAALIREKKISSTELVDAHLARIDKLNTKLNAFVEVDAEGARQQAREADAALVHGVALGPLHGVPLSIKSSIAVRGLRWEAGTKLRARFVARKDAVLVERLRAGGAVILGTTNTPELLMAWETDNDLYGRTNNPWDLLRTPGGSSGGEASAIAAGCSAGGVGSDGGGSIRVPAHFTGICGLKPTPGRIPSTGHFPESVGPFAMLGVVGPMARTIADVTALFATMQGIDYGDTSTAPIAAQRPSAEDLKQIRIAYFEDDGRTPVTHETRIAVRQAASLLREAGCTVAPFRPSGLEQARERWWQFFGVAGAMMLDPTLKGKQEELSPILRQFSTLTASEAPHTAQSLLEAWIARDTLRIEIFEQMREYPVLLCPVAAIPAFRHGEREWQIDGKTVKYLDAWSYSEWFNLLGMPVVVVPVGRSQEGMPIGVQIVARPWQEELALSIAEVVEKERGAWHHPPMEWSRP
jgi:Asp-tRNA(Asn)/Glu-tRNA(Gln) amidotransferase A subunit family amidase